MLQFPSCIIPHSDRSKINNKQSKNITYVHTFLPENVVERRDQKKITGNERHVYGKLEGKRPFPIKLDTWRSGCTEKKNG